MGRRRKKSNYHELQQDAEPQEQQPKGAKQQRRGANKRRIVKRNFGDDENFRRILEEDGTKAIVDMAADGNCLFRSVSDQLTWDYGYNHEEVRSDVCDFLELREEEFSVFLVLDENEDDDDAADFESYISTMRDSGEWGGNLELMAAARLYRRNIKVFSLAASYTIEHAEKKSTGPDLMISYHDNDHYNSLRDSKATKPTSEPVKIMPVRPVSSTPIKANIEEDSMSPESKTSCNGRTRSSIAKTTKDVDSPTLSKKEKRKNKAAKKGATGKSESQKPAVGVRKSRRVAGETTTAAVVETATSTVRKSKDKADKELVATKPIKKPARRKSKNGISKELAPKPTGQTEAHLETSVKMDVDESALKKRSASVGSSSHRSRLSANIRASPNEFVIAFNLSDEGIASAFDKEDKSTDTRNASALLSVDSLLPTPSIEVFEMAFEPELDGITMPNGLAAHDELASYSELQSLSSTSTLEDSWNNISMNESGKTKRLSERVKCFTEDEDEDDQDYTALNKPSFESMKSPPSDAKKKSEKGGKCPCGSGKAYRKCCKEKKEKATLRGSTSVVTDDDDESSSHPKGDEMENGFRVLKI